MTFRHFLLLLLLAASWGASFLFMRIAAPLVLAGTLLTTGVRLRIGGKEALSNE